jgi:hypothetical protein
MNNSVYKSPLYILFPFLMFESMYPDSSIKIVVRAFMYLFLFILPINDFVRNKKYYSKYSLNITYILIYYGIFLIFRTLFYDDNKAIFGNVFTTLFGNTQVGAMVFLLPFFIFFTVRRQIIWELKNILFLILIISIPISLYNIIVRNVESFNFVIFLQCISFLYIFAPYLSKTKKYVILIATILLLLVLILISERAVFLSLLSGILSYCLISFVKSKRVLIIIASAVIFISIAILSFGLYYKISVFEVLPQLFSDKSDDLAMDSRTFLYLELSDDLDRNNSWVFGKGILGSYYSLTMEMAAVNGYNVDSKNRIGIETGFLQYILKGGLLYLILYMIIMIIAIFRALKFANNDFLKIVAFMLVGRFFISTISEYPAFDLKNIIFWILMGLCLSDKYLKLSNSDIYALIYKKKKNSF